MFTSADAPQTPPGFPPGSVPTQGPYSVPTGTPVPLGFDSVRPEPGGFDVSSGLEPNGGISPAVVKAARALVRRYRRALWHADAIKTPSARRVAVRALRETRDALASGLTADGVAAASQIIASAVADDTSDDAPDVDGDAIATASAALAGRIPVDWLSALTTCTAA